MSRERIEEIRALVTACFQLAHARGMLEDLGEVSALDENEVQEQLSAAASDALDALRGISTCDNEPCPEWIAVVDRWRP